MASIAFVPVRIGSKGIPKKNLSLLCGKPLMYWVLKSLIKSNVDNIIVAGDSKEFEVFINEYFYNIPITYWYRSPEDCTDEAPTELAILNFLAHSSFEYDINDKFLLCQATNPWVKTDDINNILRIHDKLDVVSVAMSNHFFWEHHHDLDIGAHYRPNYILSARPRRQNYCSNIENGAVYRSTIGKILESENRVSQPIWLYQMPSYTSIEIDEPLDLALAETVFKHYNSPSIKYVYQSRP